MIGSLTWSLLGLSKRPVANSYFLFSSFTLPPCVAFLFSIVYVSATCLQRYRCRLARRMLFV